MTNEEEVNKQLREKIKSKMDVAKFFAGFITVFLGVAFKDVSNLASDPDKLIRFSAQGGMLFILGSLAFSVSAMFAYDRLMMPVALWAQNPNWTQQAINKDDLYHQMTDAWRHLFVPAVAAFFVGLLGLLIAVTHQLVPAMILWLVPIAASFLCYRAFSRRQGFVD